MAINFNVVLFGGGMMFVYKCLMMLCALLVSMQGVTCVQEYLRGEVRVNIPNEVQGSIPTSFASLVLLTCLIANDNFLSGPVPNELCLIQQLNDIFLYNNPALTDFPYCMSMIDDDVYMTDDDDMLPSFSYDDVYLINDNNNDTFITDGVFNYTMQDKEFSDFIV
eukprot:gene5318-10631_t